MGILKIEISNTIMLNLRLSLIKDRKTSKIQNGFLVFFLRFRRIRYVIETDYNSL